jgi:hypothetical protein
MHSASPASLLTFLQQGKGGETSRKLQVSVSRWTAAWGDAGFRQKTQQFTAPVGRSRDRSGEGAQGRGRVRDRWHANTFLQTLFFSGAKRPELRKSLWLFSAANAGPLEQRRLAAVSAAAHTGATVTHKTS